MKPPRTTPRRGLRSLVALWTLAATAWAAELNVCAAASLSNALGELSALFREKTGHSVRLNLGASGTLARQIAAGAPADLFISADEARMDILEKKGLLMPHTRRSVLSNRLVVIVPAQTKDHGSGPGAIAALAELGKPAVRRIAIGETATVPVGTYAKALLEAQGSWKALQGKLLPLGSARAVLAAVEAGNADAAFVYRTDALSSRRVRIAFTIDSDEAPRISYPAAVLSAAKHREESLLLLDFLGSVQALTVFERHGFSVAKPEK